MSDPLTETLIEVIETHERYSEILNGCLCDKWHGYEWDWAAHLAAEIRKVIPSEKVFAEDDVRIPMRTTAAVTSFGRAVFRVPAGDDDRDGVATATPKETTP